MKILHVLAQLPSRTGSGVYFSNMIEEFKKYEYDQKAIFGHQDEFEWDILSSSDQLRVVFKSDEIDFPIVGMSDVMPYDHTRYKDMTEDMIDKWKRAFIKRLKQAKEEFNPDIIFAHHLWMLTSIVREVFPDTKIVGLCHNTDLRQARMNPHIKEMYVKNIDKLDLIFSISEDQKKEIVEIYDADIDKIINVGGAYNQNIFYPPAVKEYSEDVKLVFCAKIDPSKGIYELVEAYRELNLENVTLDIIGNPNEENKDKIYDYIKGDDSIRLYNVKNQVALGDELRKKDIYLMPSYYEGLGLMAIECLACGLYVITTEIEALMELLGDKVNNSGVIKYVPLPRIYDVDKPVEEDIPEFKERLKKEIICQVEKIRNKKLIDKDIQKEINSHSWEGLVSKMNEIINLKI